MFVVDAVSGWIFGGMLVCVMFFIVVVSEMFMCYFGFMCV